MKKIKYIKGQLINGFEFINDVPTEKKNRRGKFKCQCGNEFEANFNDIKNSNRKYCGNCIKLRKIHGHTKHSWKHYLYNTWDNIKQRCFNKNHPSYKYYGAKGKTMYPEWINDYVAFKDWILTNLGERPENHSLDRIENSGNYEPNNLRWATSKQQRNNQN